MREIKKLETPKVVGNNVYPWQVKDTKTKEVEYLSDKGKKAVENQTKNKWW